MSLEESEAERWRSDRVFHLRRGWGGKGTSHLPICRGYKMNQKTSFRFKSYRNLKNNLGKFDAIVEYNELAVREFFACANGYENPNKYISLLSERHHIRVNAVDLSAMPRRIAQFYILSVYQQAEEFLENFRREYKEFVQKEWTDEEKDSLLEKILKNIGTIFVENRSAIGDLRIEIFEYYRLVRNQFMHTEIKGERLNKCLEKLKKYSEQINADYKINQAPNNYNEMSFEDFILFSRVTKDIAFELCQIGRPSDEELVHRIQRLDQEKSSGVNLSNFKKLKNNRTRLENALYNLLKEQYALVDKSEAEPIVKRLITGPLA